MKVDVSTPKVNSLKLGDLSKSRKGISIGKYVIARIIKRTKSGLDVSLRRFKPYSKSYSKQKGSNRVNLSDTGAMLASLKYDVDKDEITIYTDSEVAYNHQNGIGTPEREFVGVDRTILNDIDKMMIDAFEPDL